MKIYSIDELVAMNKEQKQEVMQERSDVLFNLVSQMLTNKTIDVPISNKMHEKEKETLLKISALNLKTPMQHLDMNNAVLLYLELDVELSKKMSNNSKYDSEEMTSHMNDMLGKFIDKKARVLWSVEKVANNNKLEMRLLFPDNLILPDLALLKKYKEISKKAKKADKENYKQEFQNKLNLEVEEMKTKRFNIIKNNPSYIPEDKEDLMEFIKKSNKKFDKEAVKNIIKKYSDNEEIVEACIGLFNDSLFKYVSKRLQDDRNFVIKMVNKNVNILEYAPEKYLDDDEIMNKAIDISGYIIRVVSERLKNDKQFCLAAIKSQVEAYGVIPPKMKEDNDLLMEAMNERGEFLMYSKQVKTNKELLIKAFSNAFPPQSRHLLQVTSEEFKNDKEVALAAIKCSADNILEISKELREEIGTNDPIEYLTEQINLMNKQSELNSVTKKKKLK